MASARRIAVNPANKKQRYILYSNGYIEAIGGALAISQSEGSINTWSVGSGAPVWYTAQEGPAVSFQILNWSVPSGYTLDMWGNVWPWGGATVVPGASTPLTGGPEYLFGGNGGFSSPTYGYVIDFKMDPNGGGTGYLLLYNGDVIGFGTGVTAIAHGAFIPDTAARMLQMDWTSKRYWILDNLGRVSAYNGGNQTSVDSADGSGWTATFPQYIWGRGGTYAKGGFRLYDFSATPKGWVVDALGRAYDLNTTQPPYGYRFTPSSQQWVDIDIIDDGTGGNPLRLVTLSQQGQIFEWVVSTAPVAVVTEPSGALTTSLRPWVGWQYIDKEGDSQVSYQARILTSGVYLSGTTNEVQSLNQTGAPTGGSVKLGFQRDTQAPLAVTTSIAFNAAAATIQAALEALPNIGTGGVVCAGGPWGTAPVTVTFQNQMAGWNWPQITLNQNAFTGGAGPTVAISTTTQGVGVDPSTAQSVYALDGSDNTNRVRPTMDLANGTTYRAFARVTDSSGLLSGWTYSQFNTAVTALNTPTVVAAPAGGVGGVILNVTAATGAGLPATARFAVQYMDMVDGTVNFIDPVDSDFETTAATWQLGFNSSAVQSAAFAYVGTKSLLVTSSGAGDYGAFQGTGSRIPIVGGNTYSFSAYVLHGATARSDRLTIFWEDSAGAAITNVAGPNFVGAVGAWTRVVYDGVVAPANAAQVRIQLRTLSAAAAGETSYWDAVQIVSGSSSPAGYLTPTGPMQKSTLWKNVRGADAIVPSSTGTGQGIDYEAPFNVQRLYRAVNYVYDSAADSWNSTPGLITGVTNFCKEGWVFMNIYSPTTAIIPRVQADLEWSRPTMGDSFTPVNRQDPIVITDGAPKLPSGTLKIWGFDRVSRQQVEAIANSGATLLLRTPFGESFYARVVDSWKSKYMLLSPTKQETTNIRDARDMTIPLQSIKRPKAGPTTGPLVEVG